MMQPGECSDMRGKPEERSESVPKLTRPQKRRRRLQIRAAAEALKSRGNSAKTSGSQLGIEKSDVVQDLKGRMVAIDDKLRYLSEHVANVGENINFLAFLLQWRPDCFQSPDEHSKGEMFAPYAFSSSSLNPDADMFVPQDAAAREADRMGHQCLKCGRSQDACRCESILCKGCWRPLTRCTCEHPLIRSCAICGNPADGCSCEETEQQTNSVGTYDECAICGTMRDQELIQRCDGRSCTDADEGHAGGRLCHRYCMERATHDDYSDGAFLCEQCVALGIQPGSLAGSGEASDDNDDGRDADSDKTSPAERMASIRQEIQRRLKELQVCMEVAERLAAESDIDPTNKTKAAAASAAVQRYRVAKERATPESVAEDFGAAGNR